MYPHCVCLRKLKQILFAHAPTPPFIPKFIPKSRFRNKLTGQQQLPSAVFAGTVSLQTALSHLIFITHFQYLWRIKQHRHFYESINGGEPTCIDDDIPFEIPDSWEWERIGEAFFLQAGKNISSGKIQNDYFVDSFPCYGGNGIRGYVDIYNRDGVYPIIGRQGALCGNVNLASGKFYATEHAVCVETYGDFNKEWVYSTLKALNLNQYATATAQPGLAVGVINAVLIPIPPIQEQQRIVNILDAENEKLDTLLQSRLRYNRILSETPTSLRQQLIQAAIQGQLVSQNPNDEPARLLLERIAQERTAKLGKKAAKSMSRIERRGSKTYELFPDGSEKDISEDIPFEIPRSWEWSRLGTITIKLTDGSHNPPPKKTEGYRVISAQNIRHGKIEFFEHDRFTDQLGFEKENLRTDIKFGDVILGIIGGSIGNTAIYDKEDKVIAQRSIAIIRAGIPSQFLLVLLRSPLFQHSFQQASSGSAQGGIYLGALSQLLVPLPPESEQLRIVKKLDKVLSLLAL